MDKAKIGTTRFGLVEFDVNKVINFVDDIPGFYDLRRFIMIPHGDNSPLSWLQSIDQPELAFAVIDPWLLFEDYKPDLSESELASLEIDETTNGELIVLTVLTIPENPQDMTANLKAPIIINAKQNKAKQIVLSTDEYLIKQPISYNK
ncbi:MAG: flagellar assembly protein FliW [Rubrobacteridae bacterium]|nr:flagellar assembly protein FliW [Rubrobacteridae bacterium]